MDNVGMSPSLSSEPATTSSSLCFWTRLGQMRISETPRFSIRRRAKVRRLGKVQIKWSNIRRLSNHQHCVFRFTLRYHWEGLFKISCTTHKNSLQKVYFCSKKALSSVRGFRQGRVGGSSSSEVLKNKIIHHSSLDWPGWLWEGGPDIRLERVRILKG